jgi:hypothetical protein
MLRSQLEINHRFGGKIYFHLQWQRISRARNQHESGSKRHVPQKRRLIFNRLHGVISQEIRTLFSSSFCDIFDRVHNNFNLFHGDKSR